MNGSSQQPTVGDPGDRHNGRNNSSDDHQRHNNQLTATAMNTDEQTNKRSTITTTHTHVTVCSNQVNPWSPRSRQNDEEQFMTRPTANDTKSEDQRPTTNHRQSATVTALTLSHSLSVTVFCTINHTAARSAAPPRARLLASVSHKVIQMLRRSAALRDAHLGVRPQRRRSMLLGWTRTLPRATTASASPSANGSCTMTPKHPSPLPLSTPQTTPRISTTVAWRATTSGTLRTPSP